LFSVFLGTKVTNGNERTIDININLARINNINY